MTHLFFFCFVCFVFAPGLLSVVHAVVAHSSCLAHSAYSHDPFCLVHCFFGTICICKNDFQIVIQLSAFNNHQ